MPRRLSPDIDPEKVLLKFLLQALGDVGATSAHRLAYMTNLVSGHPYIDEAKVESALAAYAEQRPDALTRTGRLWQHAT